MNQQHGGVNHVQDNRGGDTIPAIQDQDAGAGCQIGGYVMPMTEQEEQGKHLVCELAPMMMKYVMDHQDGADRLREYMSGPGLWDTSHVMEYTGWCRTYVQRLVSSGQLPYIPGKPHKFIPASVKAALEKMQTGGGYGKRKSKSKPRKTASQSYSVG